MQLLKIPCVLSVPLLIAASGSGPQAARPAPTEFKTTELYRADISGASGKEVIVSLVEVPAGATAPRHTHPGEEFVYALECSAVAVTAGEPDRQIRAGELIYVPRGAVHTVKTVGAHVRAVVFRIHDKGEPERTIKDE